MERISFTVDPMDMFLSVQIGYRFTRAAMADTIIGRTFGFEPLSEAIASRYFKLVHFPSSVFLSCSPPGCYWCHFSSFRSSQNLQRGGGGGQNVH